MLRQYQINARYACNTLLNAGRHPLNVAPTGTGKTKTGIAIIADRVNLGERVFVLTPQLEIFEQWLAGAVEAGLNPGYINDEGIIGKQRQVYICMQPSLISRMHYMPEAAHPDVLIIDEAHHSGAETYEALFNYFDRAKRLGLTATPYRYDNKPLGEYYTDIVQTITAQEAIDAGYLARPLIIIPEIFKSKMPGPGMDIDPEAQAALLGDPKIVGDVIRHYELILQGLPTLVACSTYEHARQVTNMFRDAGWRFEHIHSKMPKHTRASIISAIKNRKINGVCTVGIGTEGMDIPGLYGLIWMRRTKSLSIFLQFDGRILRPFPGKEYGIIIDCVGNTIIHGRPEWTRKWSLETDYIPPTDSGVNMILCPICNVMNSAGNMACHVCGYVFGSPVPGDKKRALPAMVDGRLVVLDEQDRELIRERLKAQRDFENEKEHARKKELVTLKRAEKLDLLHAGILERKGPFSDMLRSFGV